MKTRYPILLLIFLLLGAGLLLAGCAGEQAAVPPTDAVDTAPLDVVESFYRWWTQYPPGDARREELDPGQNQALTIGLRESIVGLGHEMRADPIVCAQDMPQGLTFAQRSVDGDRAEVLVQTLWNPGTEYEYAMDIVVSLVKEGDTWQIEQIDCPVPSG